ncbi:histidine phosphatase family protein [Georgenia sp. EYE_87]|uniref:histidine phosphatase family protein n=1 Tax=Georgenia sp. EYE_87 TaxID=2853448 RepID=UPI002002A1AC|nr:histidine phosphatase family protein [Georgenia sp. EYE_87]MCK6209790.1 histidine phosphatase family protein [Georgenia sp. EYE_87]
MQRTTVHLMRHGEVHNPDGILYGRRPGYRLSDRGQEMAARVADVLHGGGHDVRLVVASPLQRAQETALPTATSYGLEVGTDPRLIEATNHFEGVAVNANRMVLAHPRNWPAYTNPFLPSWGEPYRAQIRRMRDAVAAVLDEAAGGEALLVSHQLPIWVTRLHLERRPLVHDPRRRQCSLASLTSLTFEGRRLVGLSYWEPAGELLLGATDMVPGMSAAAENEGEEGE